MADLPSKKDLEWLYLEKGHEALVWYAWRNALRVLPVLGRWPLAEVWPKNTVRHVVEICCVSLVLAQWGSKSRDIVYTVDTVIEGMSTIAMAAKAVKATVSATATAFIAANTTAAAASAVAAAAAARVSAKTTDIVAAAAFDYQLLSQSNVLASKEWCSQPLWLFKEGGKDEEPDRIKQWRQAFDRNLRELGLDFLADDLGDLWESRPLGAHAKNYLKKFSDAVLNDPEALRRLIKGGEGENIHAVRVLLLGPGGAGKSSLADRLQGKPVNTVKKLTVGVDYLDHQPLDLYQTFSHLQKGDKPLDLYLWDFGGQTIFHGLHSAFLHENCVYVLVVDSRHEQAPDEWLHQIRHLTDGRGKVLLVTNWYEACETRQNEVRLRREFPDLLQGDCFFYFSCHDPDATGLQTFVRELEQACLASQRMVLKETLAVKDALQASYREDVFLDDDDLRAIIKSKASSEVSKVIDKLQQLGFLVRADEDNGHYCLKPEWAVDKAYALLYSTQLRDAAGVLALATLQDAFEAKVKRKHTRYLVEFLKTRSLCCRLGQQQPVYFFPDAAQPDEPPVVGELLRADDKLVIRFDLPYLPLGFHAGLVSGLFGAHITSEKDIWRQGFILRRGKSRAVVHYLPRKSVVEMVLHGRWEDYAVLLNTLLVKMTDTGISEQQIAPSVMLSEQAISVCSAQQLVDVLNGIQGWNDLIRKVREMAGKNINVNVGNGSQVAIDAHNVTQKYNADNNTVQIDADQRQQLAMIINELTKLAGELPTQHAIDVLEVKKVLENKERKPESHHLLGKVWHAVKEVADFTKTGSDIADFVLEHKAEIAAAISVVTAAF